jgi:hypothetical protein
MAPGIETRSEPRLIELRHDKAGGALFFTVLFHIWGWVGLLMAVVSVVATTFTSAVGVGTSAYVTMGLTFWIGGMVLLGFAALLGGQTYLPRYASASSGNPEYPDIRNGHPYRRNSDGTVEVLTADGSRTYKSWQEFWNATERV